MDKAVLDAIERWPDVPAVFGWLSLSRRGQWRLHPGGTALAGGYGESIQNQQILSFMDRNYTCDEQGQWFFQNGPQRVYVELASTPLIWRVSDDYSIHDHAGRSARIQRCLVDEDGHLYLEADTGLGLVHSMDMGHAADAVEQGLWVPQDVLASEVPQRFAFVKSPQALQLRACD